MRSLSPLVRLAIVFGLLSVSVLIVVFVSYDSESGPAVFRDKHERLANLPGPRVVLIGGSNLTYGMDSEQLERDVKRPVVNMAYSAGFGLRFMLDDTLPGLKSGDLAVVVPAYEQFQESLLEGTGDILNVLLYHPTSVASIKSWGQVFKIAEYTPNFLQSNFKKNILSRLVHILLRRPDTSLNYHRSDFNVQGDLVGYMRHPPSPITMKALPSVPMNPETIKVLNRFHEQATAKGVQTVLLFPSYSREAYELASSTILEIEDVIRTETPYFMPSHPVDFTFPTEVLFDNIYHVYGQGRVDRSTLMVRFIREALNASSTKVLPTIN